MVGLTSEFRVFGGSLPSRCQAQSRDIRAGQRGRALSGAASRQSSESNLRGLRRAVGHVPRRGCSGRTEQAYWSNRLRPDPVAGPGSLFHPGRARARWSEDSSQLAPL